MRLEVFPARDGDCLLLSHGSGPTFVLIDGGRKAAYADLRPRLEILAKEGRVLDLFVLTHIDADHIEGVLAFAEDVQPPVKVEEVWYNGFDQMSDVEALGEAQGDAFSRALKTLGWPWNTTFDGHPVQVERQPGPFDRNGLTLTLLSPDARKLRQMRDRWAIWRDAEAARAAARAARARILDVSPEVEVMGRKPMPVPLVVADLAKPGPIDDEAPNGSSIAFLAEADGARVLFTGDAHPDLMVETVAPLAKAAGGRLPINLLKASHHGSKGNTTAELLDLLDCHDFLFSTDGSRHGHPDPETVARILQAPAPRRRRLYFNYRTTRTAPWDDADLKARHGYECVYGDNGALTIDF